MNFWDEKNDTVMPPTMEGVYQSPGHLIRRCQQISASIFAEELGEFGLTPVQYASLLMIRDKPGIDQRSLGRLIAIDRSTIGTVTKGLEDKSLIMRSVPQDNLRIKIMNITSEGEALLSQTVQQIARVQQRLMAPLSKDEQAVFLSLLSRVVDVNNAHSRAPLVISSAESRPKS
ncbi:MarR family transcriptional regulator [Thalassospira sp. NFXS8]|jgi:DNA-binding MarR family transcriptional regulator|uniref:MarR family winged helix-turn-helix transcriptional regulator n=1 Tax=Thalassospira sp. NFXS8 TaxID=2819093 RepID=UPI0032DE42E4